MGNTPPEKQAEPKDNRYTYKKRTQKQAADSKKEEASSVALSVFKGPVRLTDMYPGDTGPLPRALMGIVDGYLTAFGFKQEKYIVDLPSPFTFFGTPMAKFASDIDMEKIGTLVLAGQLEPVLKIANAYPSILKLMTKAETRFGDRASGTLLMLAAANSDHEMVQKLRVLLPKEEADAQLAVQFREGWKEESQQRVQRDLDRLDVFAQKIYELDKAKQLEGMDFKQARDKYIAIVREYRASLKPKADDPVITRGLIRDPKIIPDVYDNYVTKWSDKLGGWWSVASDLYWVVGYGSIEGSLTDFIGFIIKNGANQYFANHASVNRSAGLVLDLVGVDFFVDYYGLFGPSGGAGQVGGVGWKSYVEREHQYCGAYAVAGQSIETNASIATLGLVRKP